MKTKTKKSPKVSELQKRRLENTIKPRPIEIKEHDGCERGDGGGRGC